MTDRLTVRTMRRDDLDIAISWAEKEGWNPGIHDADSFYAADPEGFFMGEIDGEPIGCISVVNYDDRFAFGGFYIVRPEYRARGYGKQIYAHGFSLAKDRNIGGDGVVEMQQKYLDRSGFRFAYRNIRFEGTGGGRVPEGLVPLEDIPVDSIVAYDTAHFPVPRERFIRSWIAQEGSSGWGVFDRDGNLAGFGVIRPCFTGYKIGPLFADTPEIAEAIYHGLMARAPGEQVYFDTPEPNTAAVDIALRHGMVKVFETGRMYTKSVPDLPLHEIFGITSFELG